ncbi:oxygenase MpaB family protein [Sphingomonas sp.]|uniref:oxygenase MpaB family protein n=1 Tax=Sphingomonas sp. TaxID=28214 RepID=UPI002E145500
MVRMLALPLPNLPFSSLIKERIAREVVAIFNDGPRSERPVVRQNDGLFGPASVTWRVHGDVTSMMVGGIASLLLQMLHPSVLAGVWDHSNFRTDMHGRLRRTARFIALTSYGGRGDAEAAIARVRAIHAYVGGTLPDGTPYRADDPELLAWVHVTETISFLAAWRRYAEPGMSAADQDRYFAEMAVLGTALGADPVPRNRTEAQAVIAAMRPQLKVDDRTREVSALVLNPPAQRRALEPALRLTMQAAIDLLPGWAQRMHGLATPAPLKPLIRAGTLGLAQTLRWARP